MAKRNKNQIDLIEKLKVLQPLEVLEYTGPMSYAQVRWNINNWTVARSGNTTELDLVLKSFVWNKILFIIRMKPKQGRLL